MKRPPIQALVAAALCVIGGFAFAQGNIAPAPPPVPIGPVGEEAVPRAAGQTIEGTAIIIDGDELRIGESLVRLFGIAAPEISADHGPAARLGLDELAGGRHVVCTEVDRNSQGQSVAVCAIDGTDLAAELLAQGFAAVYRVGTTPTPAERALAARYDAAEAESRARKHGIWAPRDVAPPTLPAPARPGLVESAIPKWIEQAPLLGLVAALGIIGLTLLARRRDAGHSADGALDVRVLAAVFLAEVSAIRDSAQEQHDGTAALAQDKPIPATHQEMLGLPRATVYIANADRLDLLPSDLAIRLVRFHAMHDNVASLLRQASGLRCDAIRAALQGLAQAADEMIAAR